MGELHRKAVDLEKTIQGAAFEGIQERGDYASGSRLIEVARVASRLASELEEIERLMQAPDAGSWSTVSADDTSKGPSKGL
jgi:hypothetical protein